MRSNMTFAFAVYPGKAEKEALLLTRSIRTFGGRFADNPISIFVPRTEDVSTDFKRQVNLLDASLIYFNIDEEALKFPFAGKVLASAQAEACAEGETEILVWIDKDSLVINPPEELLLKDSKDLGYRPVDHTLIGSLYNDPINSFWKLIYENCNVPINNIFSQATSADGNVLRAYFNAGILVTRPQRGILQMWKENFERLYRKPCFAKFYDENRLYEIFMHQAVLSGTILSAMKQEELQLLPHVISYPLNLHTAYPKERRPEYLNEVLTCRYDMFFDNPEWRRTVSIKEPLKSWLDEQLRC